MIRTSDELGEINAALADFHKDLPEVTKDSENPHFRSTFASLAANIKAADKKAAGHGLSVVQLLTFIDTQHGLYDGLATRINHASGQWMEAVQIMRLPKEDPQGQGSAMTYGRRYNYQGAYGLAAEDDDGAAASAASRRDPPPRERPRDPDTGPNAAPTDKQMGMIRGLMDELGMGAEDARRDACQVSGREVLHLSDLTKSEASKLIDLWKAA